MASKFPGATTRLTVTMTMINSRSTKMAGGHQGDGFYPHLKVTVYLLICRIFVETHSHCEIYVVHIKLFLKFDGC